MILWSSILTIFYVRLLVFRGFVLEDGGLGVFLAYLRDVSKEIYNSNDSNNLQLFSLVDLRNLFGLPIPRACSIEIVHENSFVINIDCARYMIFTTNVEFHSYCVAVSLLVIHQTCFERPRLVTNSYIKAVLGFMLRLCNRNLQVNWVTVCIRMALFPKDFGCWISIFNI